MARNATRVAVDTSELEQLKRRVNRLEADLKAQTKGELKAAANQLAESVRDKMIANAATAPPLSRKFVGKVKATRRKDATVSISVAGYADNGTPLPLLFWLGERGNHAAPLTSTRSHNPEGYWVMRAARDVYNGEAGDTYREAVANILEEVDLI